MRWAAVEIEDGFVIVDEDDLYRNRGKLLMCVAQVARIFAAPANHPCREAEMKARAYKARLIAAAPEMLEHLEMSPCSCIDRTVCYRCRLLVQIEKTG